MAGSQAWGPDPLVIGPRTNYHARCAARLVWRHRFGTMLGTDRRPDMELNGRVALIPALEGTALKCEGVRGPRR